ncbi:serine hydrolase domain-containing protein [Pseudonocardia xinjiangensis]|uniref:Serine hydrolase n=1 Tax=Pseudonocardia xinjiangensis TaxID=75289 RepID=A0ABX1RDG7_9PSEU|nr:serine hydrolase [Pseudonocardia xinjiangensis]NMH77470.1 serine hydrolase [Pseudonocardia xinjiangensis]
MSGGRGPAVRLVATASIVLLAMAACSSGPPREDGCNGARQRSGNTFYENNPTYTDRGDVESGTTVSTPEAEGIDGARLDAGVSALAGNNSVQSVAVVRHGRLAYERYVNGGGMDQSNNVHSVSKSILQAVLATAIEKGFINSLDDTVSRYLPGYPNADRITLRNLIEMRSGLRWTEDRTEYRIEKESDWVWAILDQGLVATPGTVFTYSSGNTHVLSAVIQAATKTGTCQFAENNLLTPLGITVEHWGRDPQGIYSGGYNVYLNTREMATFGLLYLDDGTHNGTRVIPEWAVTAAATTTTTENGSGPGYSQGWWTRTIAGHDMYFAWGYGGQFIYVMPDLDTVLVITQNTLRRDREVDSAAFVERYVIPALL